jgi:hypothetical protein
MAGPDFLKNSPQPCAARCVLVVERRDLGPQAGVSCDRFEHSNHGQAVERRQLVEFFAKDNRT